MTAQTFDIACYTTTPAIDMILFYGKRLERDRLYGVFTIARTVDIPAILCGGWRGSAGVNSTQLT